MPASAAIRRLLDVACGLVEHETALAQHIRSTVPTTPQRAPHKLPACRHWPAALALGNSMSAAVAEALTPFDDLFHWLQNPNYSDAIMGTGYMDNYAYANLVGGHSLLGGEAYALGVLLLGPGLTYPPHSHPAEEIYYVVGGRAEWFSGDGPWTEQPPGSLIHHPSGISHATRTGAEPLLALYFWWGNIETYATLDQGTR